MPWKKFRRLGLKKGKSDSSKEVASNTDGSTTNGGNANAPNPFAGCGEAFVPPIRPLSREQCAGCSAGGNDDMSDAFVAGVDAIFVDPVESVVSGISFKSYNAPALYCQLSKGLLCFSSLADECLTVATDTVFDGCACV